MHYHVSLVVEDVSNKEFGRERALSKFVRTNPKWLSAFHNIEDGRYYAMSESTDRDDIMDYFAAMREFAKNRGVTVVSETSMLAEDKRRYKVNVMYEIEADYIEDS